MANCFGDETALTFIYSICLPTKTSVTLQMSLCLNPDDWFHCCQPALLYFRTFMILCQNPANECQLANQKWDRFKTTPKPNFYSSASPRPQARNPQGPHYQICCRNVCCGIKKYILYFHCLWHLMNVLALHCSVSSAVLFISPVQSTTPFRGRRLLAYYKS